MIMEDMIMQEKYETVLRLLNIGKMSFDEIALATGVVIDKVKELADKKTI